MKRKITLWVSMFLIIISGTVKAQEWALKFDATDTNSYVDCGFNEALYPANITIEAWVYVDTWVGGGNYILATENWTEATGPRGYCLRLYPDIGAEFVLGLGVNNWGVIASGYETMDSAKWTHVAATFDGTTMKVYINGSFMLDQDVTGPMVASDQNLILGEGATWRRRQLSGKLYDVRIWSVARTEEEIKANMNTFLIGDEEGLVSNWKMDEGTGTTLGDATSSFPGSIQSGVEWYDRSSDSPAIYADWALKFDATDTNSFVDCGFSEALYPANMTIESWVYVDKWVGGGNYILATENWTEATGPRGYCLRLYPDIGAEFVLGLGVNNWGVIASGYETMDSAKWTHVAATFDGTTMKVYINGNFMLDQDVTGPMVAADQNLILGEGATWRRRQLTGKLYDLRIWNVARTEEEIKGAMNGFLVGDETGLVANWKMNEGTGTTLGDATGDHPGSIQSGVKWFSLTGTGIPRITEKQNVTFYPNPSADMITLTNQQNSVTAFTVFDVTGKLIKSEILMPNEVRNINISNLSQGIYLLRFVNNGQSQVEKLLVE